MRINIFTQEFTKVGIIVNDSNFAEIAVNYIQDNYFNGADSAVIYLGYCTINDDIMFIFDIIPC